ncbi:MAG: GAF domain-containing protein, partial [Sedimentisphaerales bacterium]|nr:GAF domain-containing protein [Sedimentisphaerales bacterium]
PDDREHLKNEVFALFAKKGSFREFINRNVHKNGKTVWLLTSGVPMLDEQGNLLGYRGVDSDITERKQAEKLIQTQRDLSIAICATGSLDEGLRLCVDAAINVSEMDCGGIYLVDEETGALDLVFHKGLTPDFIRNTSHYDADSEHARLVMVGEPVYYPRQYLTEEREKIYFKEGLQGMAILPVLHEDSVIGCLNIASHILKEVPYSSRNAIEAIVGQIGSAISRLKLEETLRAYQKQLRSLASELSLSEEHERRRIAADLHDSIGQTLAFTHIKLDLMRKAAEETGLTEPLREIEKLIEQTIKDTDLLISELSPPVLHELGLVAALEWQAEQMEQQHNLKCIFRESGQSRLDLHSDYRTVLFRAVRELLTNVVKHAHASYAKIDISKDAQFIRVTVEDDGIGFNAKKNDTHVRSGGYGLFNIRERLEHFGGYMKVESNEDRGSRFILTLPMSESK